jgi:hypothetical protein
MLFTASRFRSSRPGKIPATGPPDFAKADGAAVEYDAMRVSTAAGVEARVQ